MSRINSINTARHNIDLTKTNESVFHIKLEILFFAVFQVHRKILSISFRVKKRGKYSSARAVNLLMILLPSPCPLVLLSTPMANT